LDQTTLLISSFTVGALALLLALAAHRRISSARRSLTALHGTFEGRTLIDAVASYLEEVRGLQGDVEALADRQREFAKTLAGSTGNVGLVRYDAFEDMGGQMSFSAALLDDFGNGVVVTAINGRTEARTYAKVVENGGSGHNLSPEEQEAISGAMDRIGRKATRR
jgi:hypothetical protein